MVHGDLQVFLGERAQLPLSGQARIGRPEVQRAAAEVAWLQRLNLLAGHLLPAVAHRIVVGVAIHFAVRVIDQPRRVGVSRAEHAKPPAQRDRVSHVEVPAPHGWVLICDVLAVRLEAELLVPCLISTILVQCSGDALLLLFEKSFRRELIGESLSSGVGWLTACGDHIGRQVVDLWCIGLGVPLRGRQLADVAHRLLGGALHLPSAPLRANIVLSDRDMRLHVAPPVREVLVLISLASLSVAKGLRGVVLLI